MHLIGVFANHIVFEEIKKNVMKMIKNTNLKLICINEKNIENIKNIVFETIVFTQNITIEPKDIIKKICSNCKYMILNADVPIDIEIIENKKINCITYGINQKSTITISSIQDEKMIIYIQRNLNTIEGKEIEMGEVSMNVQKRPHINIGNLLAIFSIFIIYSL